MHQSICKFLKSLAFINLLIYSSWILGIRGCVVIEMHKAFVAHVAKMLPERIDNVLWHNRWPIKHECPPSHSPELREYLLPIIKSFIQNVLAQIWGWWEWAEYTCLFSEEYASKTTMNSQHSLSTQEKGQIPHICGALVPFTTLLSCTSSLFVSVSLARLSRPWQRIRKNEWGRKG